MHGVMLTECREREEFPYGLSPSQPSYFESQITQNSGYRGWFRRSWLQHWKWEGNLIAPPKVEVTWLYFYPFIMHLCAVPINHITRFVVVHKALRCDLCTEL